MDLGSIHLPTPPEREATITKKKNPLDWKSWFILHLIDKVSIFQTVDSTKTRGGQLQILDCIIANSNCGIDSWRKTENPIFPMNIEINQTIKIPLEKRARVTRETPFAERQIRAQTCMGNNMLERDYCVKILQYPIKVGPIFPFISCPA